MSGKKPSWMLRAGSLLLAALMVFGNLILPGGIFAASAEETGVLFSTDFENDTVGLISMDTAMFSGDRGWHINTALSNSVSFGVKEVNGNKVLAITKADSATTDTYEIKFDLQDGNNPDPSITYAELSYNIALTANMQMFFPAICNSYGYTRSAYFGSNAGKMEYNAGSGWTNMFSDGAKLQTNKWYTVKQIYRLADGENAAVVEVWIDDVKTLIAANGSPADISGFVMQLYKTSAAGSVYIDNIQFTTDTHTPAKAPVTCIESWFAESFESYELNTVLNTVTTDQWHDTATKSTYTISNDPDPSKTGNQVLQLAYNADNGSGQNLSTGYSVLPNLTQAVLEYDVWPSRDDTLYLPVFTCAGGAKPVNLIARPNSVLKYRPDASNNGKELEIGTAADFKAEQWHTIKLVVDTLANQFHIFIDDTYFVSDALRVTTPVACIQGGSYTSTGNSNTYYDNFKVTPYIPADDFKLLSNAEVTLDAGKTADLSYAFAPKGASVQAVTITSSDDTVATVADGKITALKAGSTTITLDPVQEGLESRTVTVTVTAAAPEEETTVFTEDFEDETIGNLTVGSSVYSGPVGWNVQNGDKAATGYGTDISVTVEEINGNKVLAVNKLTGTAMTKDFTLKYKLDTKLTSGSAVLSYNVGYSIAGIQAWFPNICNQGNTNLSAYVGNNDGNLVYNDGVNTANNGWQPLFAEATKAQALKWYTVQEVYTLANGENPATVSVYVDGVLTETKIWKDPPSDIGGFVVQLYKGSPAGTMYLDNFKLTSGNELHTDLPTPPALIAEEKAPAVYYAEDFENETGTTITTINPAFSSKTPNDFLIANAAIGGNTGAYLVLKDNTVSNSATISPWTQNVYKKAVLSYKVYVPAATSGTYAMTLNNNNHVMLLIENGGDLYYRPAGTTGRDDILLADLTEGKWHDIKLVLDTEKGRWWVYVDGAFCANVGELYKAENLNKSINSIYLGTYSGHNPEGIAYDDIVVSEYIPIKGFTLGQTALEMVPGNTRQLEVTVDAGEYGSAPNVTFTADDSGVVSVDMFGKVTALKDGTATITVSHPDLPGKDKTVTVTVENKVVTDPTIYYEEDFEDVVLTDGIGNLPDGLNAQNGGYRVSEFVDADGVTHKAVEVYVPEKADKNLTAFVNMSVVPKVAVLEYDLYFDDNVNTMYAMTLRGKELNGAAIMFVLQVDGVFRTNSGVQLAKLEKNAWHHIKLVGDVNTYKWYLWIDGQYIAVEDNSLYTVSGGKISGFSGLCMDTYHASGIFQGIWYDNLKIYEPITTTGMTITGKDDAVLTNGASIALDASKAEEYILNIAYTPDNASLPGATFTSSNKAVATVDGTGTIYAKGAGTATITVTPLDPYLNSVELTVTVTGDYVPKPIMEQDFQNEADGSNGPAVVSGSATAYGYVFEKNNGNKLLQVNSNDSTAHGFVDLYFQNKNGTAMTYDGHVHLSYWLAASQTSGVFYIPVLSMYGNGGFVATIAMKNGVFEYTTDGNSWTAVKYKDDGKTALFNADEWYLIEQFYDGGENSTVSMKINGREVEIKHYNRKSVKGITMQLTKWMGTMIGYVDNITVTEVDHEPMPKPDGNFVVKPTALKFVDADGNELNELTIKAQTPTVLNLAFTPLGASDRDVTITSSNTDIVNFDSFGQMIGYENGESVITATLNSNKSIKATITIKVVIEEVTSVTVTDVDLPAVEGAEDTYTLVVGDHGFATAVAAPETADYKTIMWSSSNPAVATVDSYGEILALSPGTAVIKAASQRNAEVCDTFTVVVTEPGVAKTIRVASVAELKAAMAEIAAINAGEGMTGNIEIVMAGGYYYLSETLKFGPEHGGSNGYSVIIKAAEGETPIFSGASVVTGTWTKEEAGYYSIQVSKDFNSRQLYVNNVRAVRARSEGGLTNSKFIYDDSAINVGYVCDDIDLASFKYAQDLELVFKEQWTQPRAGVNYIVDNGDGTVNLIMDQPGWSGVGNPGAQSVTNKGGTSVGNSGPVWYENALELLDASGEWYLDTHTSDEYNILYYMPRPWENLATAVVTMPTLDNSVDIDGADGALVEISGTFTDASHNYVSTQVMNIHFEGITFADTTWMRPSTGYGVSDAQNNHIRENGDKMAPAAVLVEAANAIWFTDCTFTRLGINGLQMINGVQNSLIIGNHFFDISGNAINIGEPETGTANAYAQGLNVMKNNDILNNFIHNIGVDYGSSAAISVGFASDMDMNHNEIFDTPYSGWHIGYGWNNRFPNNNKYMLLEYNFVHDFMDQGIYDGGAFYILGNTSGESYNYIQHNYIRKQMNAHGALYPDQGTTWFKFIENVIDLSEVDSWVSGAPKWSHTNMATLHLHFIDNFSTTDYKTFSNEINFETDDIVYGDLHISADASWTDPAALDVIENAGLQPAYYALRNGQVERFEFTVNGAEHDGDAMVLNQGESFQLGYVASAIRKGEIVTSGLNYNAYYESQNPAVAEVDENGKVVAKGSGITKVRVWVLSNGIVDMAEVEVIADDSAESVYLAGIEDTITMSTAVSGWTLQPVIKSKLGRELVPDSVIFGIGDKSIATVSQDGTVVPVAVGTTSLTVTATYFDVTVTAVYKVVITPHAEIVVSNAADMFKKDNENQWVSGNTTNFEVVDGVSVTGKHNSFATFGGTKYDNELLSFRLKIDKVGISSNWPSIMIRAQGTSGEPNGGDTNGYMICMGSGGIEVYRFVDKVRYVIHGNQVADGTSVIRLPGAANVIPDSVSGFTYKDNVAEHDIQVGAIADGGDVRILLYVDGVKVVDYLDLAGNGAISKPGYFGMVGRNQTFTLYKDTSISDDADSGEGGDEGEDLTGKVAMIGDVAYEKLEDAIAAAAAGETIVMLADAELDVLVLNSGVKLDLNGFELSADYVVAFDGNAIVDSAPGVGLVKSAYVSLAKNNDLMPVWDEAAGGYRLFPLKSSQMFLTQSADKFEFLAKPLLGNKASSVFMSQAETNGLTFKVRMSWTNASGNEVNQDFTLKGEDLKTIYSQAEQVVSLKVSGAGSYVNRLQVSCYIVSQTGVEWLSAPDLFVGQ